MTKLSVNVNKIATLRNARGGEMPNVVKAAKAAERFGADGITIHPRPDERHIKAADVYDLARVLKTEFNIEGYPDDRYLHFIEQVRPTQATLVPDGPDVLTSNAGWDTQRNSEFLKNIISQIHRWQVRVSVFVDPDVGMVEGAAQIGADRVELYTEAYASGYQRDCELAIQPYLQAAEKVRELQMGLNAGHDLNLDNLAYFKASIPWVEEVSIGHALVSDALYYGLENTIGLYLRQLSGT